MFTGPLQQLQTIADAQRRAMPLDEGGTLCRFETDVPRSTEVAPDTRVLAPFTIWQVVREGWLELARRRAARPTGKARTV